MPTGIQRSTWRRRAFAGILLTASAIAIIPAFAASAAIPNSATGQINACYNTNGGALRVIDAQAGDTCRTGEQPLNWPASSISATQYTTSGAVDLPHDQVQITVLSGTALPPGTWSVSANVLITNGTGGNGTMRCGLYNSGGGQIGGNAATIFSRSYVTMNISDLVTLTAADRIDVRCADDQVLPLDGPLVAQFATVIAVQVASRF